MNLSQPWLSCQAITSQDGLCQADGSWDDRIPDSDSAAAAAASAAVAET
jgi:hypothetical protein